MKTKISLIVALSLLAVIISACSFTTANISSFNLGKNDTATPPTTTFDVGEKVYAVTVVSNAMGKHKVKFKVTFENVQGKSKGETAGSKDFDLDGSGTVNFFFSSPLPGEYKIEAALVDENGKEIEKKSGTATLKGSASAPAASTDSKKSDAADHDAEDKSHDK